jgi:DENN (AEX-3) domain/ENTH domain
MRMPQPPQHTQAAASSPQEYFLHRLSEQQQILSRAYSQKPPNERGKPLIAVLEGIELFGSTAAACPSAILYRAVDASRFIIPTCLLLRRPSRSSADAAATHLQERESTLIGGQTTNLLPLVRCVGVANALRILAALLSERRLIFTSASPTRLSSCARAAVTMLQCGLLHWQHLFIPVMPLHLWQYLAAPYPYLIGILSSALHKLNVTDGLGEVLIIHLDTNHLETRNIEPQSIAQRLPDLFQSPTTLSTSSASPQSAAGGNGIAVPTAASSSEFLAQDLLEILKADKKILYGDSLSTNFVNVAGETAGKAAKAIKSGFLKLRARYKASTSGVGSDDGGNESGGEQQLQQQLQQQQQDNDNNGPPDENSKSSADDYIFAEGCHNEVGEEEARIAFTVFFLCMYGDMRWYLTVSSQQGQPGQTPALDRNKFLQTKRQLGDGQGTAMWPLLQNFCQTQMLEEFAKARIHEVRYQQPCGVDAPLFTQCAYYHRQQSLVFEDIFTVRRVARQIAQANPGRLTGLLQTNARRMAMTLTSNKTFEGEYTRSIAQLVDQCRESSSVLFDVMSVIWLRLRDSRGMQWKHGFHALQLLKNLLYHGPLGAVAEATDGLEKIRVMKFFENMRSQVQSDVRSLAQHVYSLLVDRAKLFFMRRVCAEKRRCILQEQKGGGNAKSPLQRCRLIITTPFGQMHATFHPLARSTVARIPPAQTAPRQQQLQQQQQQEVDFLGLTGSGAASDEFRPKSSSNDVINIFSSLAVSSPPNAPQTQQQQQRQNWHAASPTIVALPSSVPVASPPPQQQYHPAAVAAANYTQQPTVVPPPTGTIHPQQQLQQALGRPQQHQQTTPVPIPIVAVSPTIVSIPPSTPVPMPSVQHPPQPQPSPHLAQQQQQQLQQQNWQLQRQLPPPHGSGTNLQPPNPQQSWAQQQSPQQAHRPPQTSGSNMQYPGQQPQQQILPQLQQQQRQPHPYQQQGGPPQQHQQQPPSPHQQGHAVQGYYAPQQGLPLQQQYGAYPQQQQPQQYDHPPPNPFAPPQQQQGAPPPKKNVSQFDPFSQKNDPFS